MMFQSRHAIFLSAARVTRARLWRSYARSSASSVSFVNIVNGLNARSSLGIISNGFVLSDAQELATVIYAPFRHFDFFRKV